MKTFADILSAIPQPYTLTGDPDTPITAPVAESDADVQPGGVFVARGGRSTDGHTFIPRALERGAAAVVGERDITGLPVPYARVENAAEALGHLAAAYHDHPSRDLIVIGVTGTDGKTTTSTILHSILKAADFKAGLISTVSADLGDETLDTGLHVTTPSAPVIQHILARMRAAGLTHVVLEITSHGLAQGRLNGVDLDVAVLTNITHEHLDEHGSFEAYRAAKGRMFAMLATSARKPRQPKTAIINGDDPNADYFAAFPADRVVRYARHASADVRVTDVIHHPGYMQFVLHFEGKPLLCHLPLVGDYNAHNAAAASSAARAVGVLRPAIQAGLARVPQIPGRMERIDMEQPFTAIVDFAHTPNALKNALETARTIAGDGRVIAVFGSAGLRDVEKRKLMAQTSVQLADFTILTAEDPRTESLDAILDMMAEAAVSAGGVEGKTFIRVPDRGAALFHACQIARPGDVVIACGKGHEQSMAFGKIEYPWDDRAALRAALQGEPLRTLPTA